MGLIEKKILKKGRAMEKIFIEQNLKFVYLCVREKNDGFEITVTVLRYVINVNLLFEKDFKIAL